MEIIEKAVEIIKNGGVVICPTDTVYGLICDATNKETVEKVFKIKKRQKSNPLPIFVKDIKMAKGLAKIDKNQEKFLKSVWPGKITVVLKSEAPNPKSPPTPRLRRAGETNSKFKISGVNKKTIALRIPKHKTISYLLSVIGRPLTGTSANISGKPASGSIKEILKQFKNPKHQPDFIIDAGNLPKSKPSKIIDLTTFPYKVVRS